MKLNKLWASALALLALASCGKDLEPSVNTVEPAPLQTKTVSLSLTASPDADALRVLYDMNGMDNGAVGPFKWSDKYKQLKIRVGVRRGTGEPIIQDLIFNKVGNNRASYEGPVTIPTDGAGDYSIAAALLSELEGATENKFLITLYSVSSPEVLSYDKHYIEIRRNIYMKSPGSSNGVMNINVPYLTRWQPLEVESDKAKHTRLNFEPQGTVLRIRIKNETSKPQTFHRIKITSNNLVNSGTYFFKRNPSDTFDWVEDNLESVILSIPSGGVVVPGKTSTNTSYSPWLYTWVQPRTISFTPLTTVSLSTGYSSETAPFKLVFKTGQRLPSGSVPLTLTYKDGGLDASFDSPMDLGGDFGDTNGSTTQPVKPAIDYLAPYVLNAAGTGFVNSYATTFGDEVPNEQKVGFFYAPEAIERFSTPFAIPAGSPDRYSMLTRDEAVGILPPILDASASGDEKFIKGRKTYNVHETSVKIGAFTRDYLSDYYVTADGGTFYGLRFKNSENCTAFRYKIQEISGSQVMKIECILLGAGNTLELDDIAQESYWTKNEGDIVSRILPLYGQQINKVNPSVRNVNDRCYYLTSTKYGQNTAYFANVYRYYEGEAKGLWTIANLTGGRFDRNSPILLMKRN